MKIFILLALFIFNGEKRNSSQDCAFFYENQLSGILIDNEIKKIEVTPEYFLIHLIGGKNDLLKIMKNEIGIKIFSSIRVGDRLLKNSKDFIGFAIIKYDSNNQIVKIDTYKNLCSN